ncbi:hypothetical protein, partial [Bradyrhizobium nanningense]|uniref:hypothetical protein n=1 Tax=Bradyrhizobium nanningense TaxID=1325118 RepID=UPI0019D70F99
GGRRNSAPNSSSSLAVTLKPQGSRPAASGRHGGRFMRNHDIVSASLLALTAAGLALLCSSLLAFAFI